ncbi:MAG TPA: OmpA family protein [Methylothermaceae bacterium]|nr:OmpA family protein [Methylothermaceae bacterium]
MRCFLAFLVFVVMTAGAQEQITGAQSRYRFVPGDQPIYANDFRSCPVGEFVADLKILAKSYECARFRDRIWIRPLARGAILWLPLSLPEEFSIEIDFYPGTRSSCVMLGLHRQPEKELSTPLWGYLEGAAALKACGGERLQAGVARPHQSLVDVKGVGGENIRPGQVHRLAVQVRRGQIRFYLDGREFGRQPFRYKDLQGISLSFFGYHDEEKFRQKPPLVTALRIAAYAVPEAVPQAEADLIRALGAVETSEGLKVTLQEAILFDFGRWQLKPEAQPVLDRLARLIKLRGKSVRVEGHTDNVGGEMFNLILSELRAHVVARAPTLRGVDPKLLEPKGFGESRPVASNATDAGRARNRRVEVIIAR